MADLRTTVPLLSIIARRLGYDWLLLMSWTWHSDENWCRALLGHHKNYDNELLEVNDKQVWLKSVDAEGRFRSNEDMYVELVRFLYNVLENGGYVSDGKKRLNADKVPEFMVECVLNGFVD